MNIALCVGDERSRGPRWLVQSPRPWRRQLEQRGCLRRDQQERRRPCLLV